MPIRVLIVDDHAVVRQGLTMFLETDPDLEIVGQAENGKEAIEKVKELNPQVVIMDLLMPVMDGITSLGLIRRDFPQTEVIALTSVLEDDKVVAAIKAGAIGYLLKDTNSRALCQAIKAAAAGQVQLDPQAAVFLMRQVRGPEHTEALTDRESEVLVLMARGQSNKEIAGRLKVGDQTVKTHVSNILAKLGVHSRTQAALHAIRSGLVEAP